MDLVLAIRGVIARAHSQIILKHVKGHVGRDRPRSEWTLIESINVACDEEAEKCVEMGITPLPFHPLPGARCLLQVHDRWVTASPTTALQTFPAKEAISAYLAARLKVTTAKIGDIDEQAIAAARSNHGWARSVRVTKMMTGWLPVGHNWRHHGAANDLCPCCGRPDETFYHLLQCPDPQMVELRDRCLRNITRVGAETRLPALIIRLLELMIRTATGELREEPPLCGVMHSMAGWISKSWARGLRTLGSTDPHGQSAQILTLLWDSLCEPVWSLRNDIFNNIPNPSTLRELTDLRSRLLWYHRFVNQVLPPRFRFIASFQEDSIQRWDRTRCRLVLRQLATWHTEFMNLSALKECAVNKC
jgi:hypothetical protein